MTKQEADRIIRDLKKLGREHSKSDKKALRFLQDAGILTPTGKLRRVYQTPKSSE